MRSKVLLFLHLPPPLHGSSMIGRNIKESRMVNEIFDTTYINLSTSSTLEAIGKISIAKYYHFFKILLRSLVLLLIWRPDYIYFAPTAKGFGFSKDITIALFLKVFRRRTIFHFHNVGWSDGSRIKRQLTKFVFHENCAIVLSKTLSNDVRWFFREENIFVCANGIFDQNADFVKHNVKNSSDDKIKILFLSNYFRFKGVLLLLDICEFLKIERNDFVFVLAGADGDLTKEELKNEVNRRGLSDYFYIHGPVNGKDKDALFRDAGVFVLPTYADAFPTVLVEALMWGLPVIANDVGGIRDIFRHEKMGYLVTNNAVKEYVVHLTKLLSNPLIRREMSCAARTHFLAHFRFQAFETRLIQTLKQAFDYQIE